jgi:hypothetical protein
VIEGICLGRISPESFSSGHNGSHRWTFLALLIFLLGGVASHGASPSIRVRSQINASKVRVGDTFQLDLIVTTKGNAEVDTMNIPDMRDFQIVRTHRSQQSSVQISSGRRMISVEYKYTYLLQANKPGLLAIGETTARSGKTVARAPPIRIKVVGATGSPKTAAKKVKGTNQQSPPAGKKSPTKATGGSTGLHNPTVSRADPEAFILDMQFEKSEVFVGEQVNLITRVFSTSEVEIPGLPQPKLEGFWIEPLQENTGRATQRIINGTRYYVYVVQTLALFPFEVGQKMVEPRELQIQTRAGFWSRGKKYKVQSQPANLNVSALPAEGQPVAFPSANVGSWKLSTRVSPRTTRIGDPVTFQIVAEGEGNLQQLVLPEPPKEVEGARLFPPTFSQKKFVQQGSLRGRKVAEMLLQPVRAGVVRIPAISMPIFDPSQGRYRILKTKPIRLKVSQSNTNEKKTVGKKDIEQGVRPIHNNLAAGAIRLPPQNHQFFQAATFSSIALSFIIWGLGLLRGRRKNSLGSQLQSERRHRQATFQKAIANNDVSVLQVILMQMLSEKYGKQILGMVSEELVAFLASRGMDRADVTELVEINRQFDAIRYSPMTSSNLEDLCRRAETFATNLEKSP